MSDLHQYELHYNYREGGVFAHKKRLVWAYTVQEAVYQLNFELSRYGGSHVITEAGPVKKAVFYKAHEASQAKPLAISHFHVCTECQDVLPCLITPCPSPERNDWLGRCQACINKKATP